jgi:hypothetical protein
MVDTSADVLLVLEGIIHSVQYFRTDSVYEIYVCLKLTVSK